jgi:hypothetical protein
MVSLRHSRSCLGASPVGEGINLYLPLFSILNWWIGLRRTINTSIRGRYLIQVHRLFVIFSPRLKGG